MAGLHGMGSEGERETVEKLGEKLHVVVPLGTQTFVAVVVVEHMDGTAVESGEIACPYQFFFALLCLLSVCIHSRLGMITDTP